MKTENKCALAIGVIFTLIGIAGFVPAFVSLPSADVSGAAPLPIDMPSIYTQGFGYLFGLFPINLLHNLLHLSVGLFGIAASSTIGGARLFNRFFAISYLAISLMGLLPLTRTSFGVVPLFGNNVWFNALTALIAGYFGFAVPQSEPTTSL